MRWQSQLSVQLSLVSPAGRISPFGMRTSKQEEHKLMGTGNKLFATGSLRVVWVLPLPFLPLVTGLALGRKATSNECWCRAYKAFQRSEDSCSSSRRCFYLAGSITNFAKVHCTILSGQLLQDSVKCNKTGGFHVHGTTVTLHLLWSESYWSPHVAVWNTVTGDKAVYKSTIGSLVEAWHSRQANFYPECQL